MNIHSVTHAKGDKNRYCGPSAISILTGMNTGEAARLLRHITGKKQIQGTGTGAVRKALLMCGLHSRPVFVPTKTEIVERKGDWFSRGGERLVTKGELTLAAWLKQTVSLRTSGRVFLVVAGNHWQVITGRRYCCGQTGDIVSITDKKVKRRARVTEVYEITQPGKITIPRYARKPKATMDPSRRCLEMFLKEKGIPKGRIVPDGHIKDYVIPPCDAFRKGFSTMHHDWGETYGRVTYCYENPSVLLEEDGHFSA